MIDIRVALEQLSRGDWLDADARHQLARVVTVIGLHQPAPDGLCLECHATPCMTRLILLTGGQDPT